MMHDLRRADFVMANLDTLPSEMFQGKLEVLAWVRNKQTSEDENVCK